MAEQKSPKCNDVGDAKFFDGSRKSKTNLVANMPTQKDSPVYNMKHKHRGLALIFNHKTFDKHLKLKTRNGTEKDGERLCKSLESLQFKVKHYEDQKYNQLRKIVENASEIDHTDHDCILIAILTHGNEKYLCAQDTEYKLSTISNYFTADNCKTLAGKPKLFFIQACQGGSSDSGIELRGYDETDGQSNSYTTYRIPIHADFLLAYSTIPGFLSYRNDSGSWFIQSLCDQLDKNGKKYDILTLLTLVCREVAVGFEIITSSPERIEKQVPCTTTMLTRILKFNDKA